MRLLALLVSFFFLAYVLALSSAEQCGEQNQGLPCPGGLCCSKWGFCGTTPDYCLPENGCQMNCTRGGDDDDPVDGSAKSYPAFAATGDEETRKREVAAFFGQTSHETTGGWPTAPGGPYSRGHWFNEEIGCPVSCQPHPVYPCAPGQSSFGRGPLQISWEFNYDKITEAYGY